MLAVAALLLVPASAFASVTVSQKGTPGCHLEVSSDTFIQSTDTNVVDNSVWMTWWSAKGASVTWYMNGNLWTAPPTIDGGNYNFILISYAPTVEIKLVREKSGKTSTCAITMHASN